MAKVNNIVINYDTIFGTSITFTNATGVSLNQSSYQKAIKKANSKSLRPRKSEKKIVI